MKAPASRSSIFQLLKQHFTGPKRVELPVSAYGKLPIYKDFLRHGLAGQEAQAFKRWLDRGVSRLWAGHESYSDEEIPTHAVLLSFPATGKSVLGYLWGSHDHGGLRQFPFALFVSLPAPSTSSHLPLIFALDQVVEQASALRRKLEQVPSLDAYYPLIRTSRFNLEIHGEKALRERLLERQEPTVGDLADVFYGEDDEADRWPALLRHLRRIGESPTKPFAGRLPNTGALPAAELASLWSLLIGDSRRQAKKPLQLIYSPGASYAGITLLCRDLQPEDVFAFHPEMPDYEAITDYRREVPGARRPAPPPSPAGASESTPETSPEEGSEDSVPSESTTSDAEARDLGEPPDKADQRPEASGETAPEEPSEPDEKKDMGEHEAAKDSQVEESQVEESQVEESQVEESQAGDKSRLSLDEKADAPPDASPADDTPSGTSANDDDKGNKNSDGGKNGDGGGDDEVDGEVDDEPPANTSETAASEPTNADERPAESTRDSEDDSPPAEPRSRPAPGELTREQRAAPFHAVLDESFLRR